MSETIRPNAPQSDEAKADAERAEKAKAEAERAEKAEAEAARKAAEKAARKAGVSGPGPLAGQAYAAELKPLAPEPTMSIKDLRAWAADPDDSGKKAKAVALLKKCGPLVADGVHYRLGEKDKIESRPADQARREAIAQASVVAKPKGNAKPAFDEDLD